MTHRIGIDLLDVESVNQALLDHGDHYLRRVYTPIEVADSTVDECIDPSRLAARFAAKEATLKVLRLPDTGMSWQSIAVERTSWGGVTLALSGLAEQHACRQGLTAFDVSLSHQGGFAVAAVLCAGAPA